MAVHYESNDAQGRVIIITSGYVSTDDVIALLERQANDGAWSYAVLYDARASVNVPTQDDIRRVLLRVGALTTRYGPRGPVAFVSTAPHLTRMTRMYAKLGELTALNMQVFSNLPDAEAWLDQHQGRSLITDGT